VPRDKQQRRARPGAPVWKTRPKPCECDAAQLCGSELLRRANAADAAGDNWTRADCAVENSFERFSSGSAFRSGTSQINDARAKIDIIDGGGSGGFGQQARFGHPGNRVHFQHGGRAIFG